MADHSAIARTARKRHLCEFGYGCTPIDPGDTYYVLTEFPNHDAGYAASVGHPVSLPMCASCAVASVDPVTVAAVNRHEQQAVPA